MNRAIRRTAEAWLAHGRDAVIVTVIESRGARAVRAGTRMLVSEGQRVGSIGGGHLELQSTCLAEELLSIRATAPRQVSFPLGPASR
ncbi:MAG: XdhC family protein, partial [Rhizobacter sp.]